MKILSNICLLTAFSLTAIAAYDSTDFKALQGTWLPVKAEFGGQPIPATVLKTIVLRLHKNRYEATVSGIPDTGTWVINSSTKPKSMSITGVKGPNAGKTFPCIYEITGNLVRVCYDLSGAKRPTEFKTTAGTKLYLVTYNRKK